MSARGEGRPREAWERFVTVTGVHHPVCAGPPQLYSTIMPTQRPLLFVSLALIAPSLELRLLPLVPSTRRVPTRSLAELRCLGAAPVIMRGKDGGAGDDTGYLSQNLDVLRTLATERPVFFALRIAILGGGVLFFGKLALALVQRAI